jgi:hypothetical protein
VHGERTLLSVEVGPQVAALLRMRRQVRHDAAAVFNPAHANPTAMRREMPERTERGTRRIHQTPRPTAPPSRDYALRSSFRISPISGRLPVTRPRATSKRTSGVGWSRFM